MTSEEKKKKRKVTLEDAEMQTEHRGVEIGYSSKLAGSKQFFFTLRGRFYSVHSLACAKDKIDKLLNAKDPMPFVPVRVLFPTRRSDVPWLEGTAVEMNDDDGRVRVQIDGEKGKRGWCYTNDLLMAGEETTKRLALEETFNAKWKEMRARHWKEEQVIVKEREANAPENLNQYLQKLKRAQQELLRESTQDPVEVR